MAALSQPGASTRYATLRRLFVGPFGYLALALIIAIVLVVGSASKSVAPDTARIAYLESIIRCPSCADLSIADSEAPSARGLRVEVASLVRKGVSDPEIEARIEALFPGTLLLPGGGVGVVIFLIPAAIIVAGAIAFATLLFRRTRRVVDGDDSLDRELVEAAQRVRNEGG
jgi:cytochrome c-type biogenesis protein CcmH/NrfF